ncbi:TIM-barrel domain-containing protein [Cellvibrio sp. pealriver]|uniref:glycoside hydrolase family 31 protein n=1 Tax=Cellvibrio sp. pealriver TaxID=1622269 RepID=UPI001E2B5B9E|nr:TIM-barrel domain-containing protein [Cellvibrio sp. pealriver]
MNGILVHSSYAATNNPVEVNGAYVFVAGNGERLRITPYGEFIVRVQRIRTGENFLPDDHYEMVERHDWSRDFRMQELTENWNLVSPKNPTLKITVDKKTLTLTFFRKKKTVLQEEKAWWQGRRMGIHFVPDAAEHFTGLGHSYYGRESSIDLRGKVVGRNYGKAQIQQAPLIVPFYLSSKGYGVFLNSTFSNQFSFSANTESHRKYDYSIVLDDHGFGGQLDYFYIDGPELKQVLNNYTQLTGRPRLPMKAVFGLQLSDKGHDHDSSTPSDQSWWQEKITHHRKAGYPLDHVINDNRWRAGGGKRCESRMEWDQERYPDPKLYAQWLKANGLISTLDINRCIAQFSRGWKAEFNIQNPENIEFSSSAPDLTNAEFRKWFWNIFYQQSLDPQLQFPGDALWIDEFDEMGAAPDAMKLASGRSWAEMRNYWFFLISKALVQEGWDKSALRNKRPYVWVRGMTAGAQRYASLWSGDIYPNHNDMQAQIRAMQLAGMSGFPFWGHDAGGFYDWNNKMGPDENLYAKWAMAFGSFAPIWKPHGMGQSRWPLDRSLKNQEIAKRYTQLRYELMPYIYTAAHIATATGGPMARPMLLDYQNNKNAWKYDLQYMWGDSFLVAPHADSGNQKELWLPPGSWYDFYSKKVVRGNRVIKLEIPEGFLPLYVKLGAIIPRYDYALSTAFANKEKLFLDVYVGANASAELIEDDDRSEGYRNGELQRTQFFYDHKGKSLRISEAQGDYMGAPKKRSYEVRFYGETKSCWELNGNRLVVEKIGGQLIIKLPSLPVSDPVNINQCSE